MITNSEETESHEKEGHADGETKIKEEEEQIDKKKSEK